MELLKNKILEEGRVEGEDILKVDSFLNHKLDINLLNEIGKNLEEYLKMLKLTKF